MSGSAVHTYPLRFIFDCVGNSFTDLIIGDRDGSFKMTAEPLPGSSDVNDDWLYRVVAKM
jgi:hypothetical protein